MVYAFARPVSALLLMWVQKKSCPARDIYQGKDHIPVRREWLSLSHLLQRGVCKRLLQFPEFQNEGLVSIPDNLRRRKRVLLLVRKLPLQCWPCHFWLKG